MRWAEGFIAVDWGTTNRRAYRFASDGRCEDELEDSRGILSVPSGGFPAAVQDVRDRLGDLPLLLAGMAGSTRGWMGAPYLPCPAGLPELASSLVWPEPDRAAIVPGVSYSNDERADIMRGEEVQILGAVAAGTIPADCAVCHPGTHNKWVVVHDGRIESFKTVMTGEMFNLLRNSSILSEHLKGDAGDGEAFRQGVRRGLSADVLTAEIFSIRARALLGRLCEEDSASFASGILIGADVAAGAKSLSSEMLFVMGNPSLTRLYAAALREIGRDSVEIDGEGAFLEGARRIAELIE